MSVKSTRASRNKKRDANKTTIAFVKETALGVRPPSQLVPMRLKKSHEETIDHPNHYHKASGVEVIDAIEAWQLSFSLGNCVKYIARAAFKGNMLNDLRKAKWYLDRAIFNVEQGKAP